MDKILRSISSPFGTDLSLGDELIKLFTTMHAGNADMVYQIFRSITPEALETVKKYVDIESIGKKKRVFRKIIGAKQGPSAIEVEYEVARNTHIKN